MAGYNPRRGIGTYSNIANLNTMPTDYEMAMRQQQEGYNLQADLDLFTNTQFFDFDMVGEAQEFNASPTGYTDVESPPMSAKAGSGNATQLDFMNSDFAIPNFTGFPVGAPERPHVRQLNSSVTAPPNVTSPATSSAGTSPQPTRTAEKRKSEAPEANLEDASRAAAEEDKRRRNTAASARFRVKKKQREQALEKNAKDMTDRVSFLETRVSQLEMENKLLKDLITEKSGKEVDMTEIQKKVNDVTPDNLASKQQHQSSAKSAVKVEPAPARA